MPSRGYPVVLTADRSLMAAYSLLFDGMLAASQTTTAPLPLLAPILMPRAAGANGVARVAPLGLRRIEAALRDAGFGPADVAIVDEWHLDDAIGPDTRIVGLSSGEPAGLGMNSSTMVAVAGGRIYPQALFQRLLRRVHQAVQRRAPAARLLLGGPGAWQLARHPELQQQLGIHHVVCGYAEGNVAAIVQDLLAGRPVPPVLDGEGVPPERVPRIGGASTMGGVEISRGCGLGCSFCTLARVPMVHLPEETVVADAATNVRAGQASIALLSEDLFRYGGRGTHANPPALLGLLRRLRAIPGLRAIQVDHANVMSLAQFSDAELAETHALLVGPSRSRYLWLNLGIETASGSLLRANGGRAKMGPAGERDWAGFCAAQVRRLCRVGFFPLLSLLIGLPGEREEDVRHTLEWVRALSEKRVAVFPMLYAPIDGSAGLSPRTLTRTHWDLIRTCYRLNFRWVPRMYWDNQAAAGVPLARRLLLQALGRGQMVQWRALFAWRQWGAAR